MADPVQQLAPTAVEGEAISFRLPDPDHERPGVRLWCDLDLGRDLDLTNVDGGWELTITLPPVDCLEYLFEIPGDPDPTLEIDPGNPDAVDGAFGEHSWLAMPGYQLPTWLTARSVEATIAETTVADTPVGDVHATVWSPSPAAPDEPLPLLVAHDGQEMDEYGRLTHYVGTGIAAGAVPRMRVALLEPGERNEWYAANPAYATSLCDHVVPHLLDAWPSNHCPVLTGQSLGGLAALHAAWTSPGTFGGLFLQSGSFFTSDLDPQESGFECWEEVTRFVLSVHAATAAAPGAPRVTLTCGTAEENHANNALMAEQLARTGMDVTWGHVRQGHTWTCWRDLLDPHLGELLRQVWG